jgi:beta-lactamase regulating signal transducer with metallopeptidase domain
MPDPQLAVSVLVQWLATYLLHSTLLVAGVAAVLWLARRRIPDAAADVAWKVALTAAVLSATVQLGLGIRPVVGALELDTGHPSESTDATRRHVVANDRGRMALSVEPTAPEPAPLWPAVVAVAFLAGAGTGLGRLAVAAARRRKTLRSRTDVLEDPVLESFLELCQRAGRARKTRLTACDGIDAPVVLGRAEICLPGRALRELTPAQIHGVLARELVRLERRDAAWDRAAAVVEAALFVQPFNRLVRRRMQRVAGVLCDDWGARHGGTGERPAPAESAGTPMGLGAGLATVAGLVIAAPVVVSAAPRPAASVAFEPAAPIVVERDPVEGECDHGCAYGSLHFHGWPDMGGSWRMELDLHDHDLDFHVRLHEHLDRGHELRERVRHHRSRALERARDRHQRELERLERELEALRD